MPESLKRRMAQGEKQVGCVVVLPSADVAEVLAEAGMPVVMIDQEHGGGTLQDFIAQSRAMRGSGTEAIVRIPHGDHAYAQRLLDNGARGLVCPGVDTAEQAAAFVKACRYPPRGSRGAGSGLRAARFGVDAQYYLPEREDDLLIVAQIESALAVENIDEICAVPGVDMLLIGPRDLAASIGKLGALNDPEAWRLVNHAAQRIRASGKLLASTLHPGRTMPEMFAEGYDLILASKDVDFLINGAAALIAQSKSPN